MNITRKHEKTEKLSQPFPHSSPILGLHCSGANGSQWACLKSYFSELTEVLLPDFIGTSARGHLTGKGTFSLADEAQSIVPQIVAIGRAVHIVGHSYGGAVALHIAKIRPDIVKSVCVYEPTLFSILDTSNPDDQKLFSEIVCLTRSIREALAEGAANYAAQVFTDFWGGIGAWQALPKPRREAMVDWVFKAPLDFDALLNEAKPKRIIVPEIPTTILVGEQTHAHTKRIAELLSNQGQVRIVKIKGAGHLGPFTFKDTVNAQVVSHIISSENPSDSRADKIAAMPPLIRRTKNRINHPANVRL